MKKFSTTIKRKWWNEKMKDHDQDGYFWEWKEETKHWVNRIDMWQYSLEWPKDGVFLVGSEPHRVKIYQCVKLTKWEATVYCKNAKKYVGEMKTDIVYGLKCKLDTSGFTTDNKRICDSPDGSSELPNGNSAYPQDVMPNKLIRQERE
jgi:hypothetical protein